MNLPQTPVLGGNIIRRLYVRLNISGLWRKLDVEFRILSVADHTEPGSIDRAAAFLPACFGPETVAREHASDVGPERAEGQWLPLVWVSIRTTTAARQGNAAGKFFPGFGVAPSAVFSYDLLQLEMTPYKNEPGEARYAAVLVCEITHRQSESRDDSQGPYHMDLPPARLPTPTQLGRSKINTKPPRTITTSGYEAAAEKRSTGGFSYTHAYTNKLSAGGCRHPGVGVGVGGEKTPTTIPPNQDKHNREKERWKCGAERDRKLGKGAGERKWKVRSGKTDNHRRRAGCGVVREGEKEKGKPPPKEADVEGEEGGGGASGSGREKAAPRKTRDGRAY
ncbi:hypothetical protein ZHAS_00004508 [Anopheles sinensis]|uniref:Uncharacterized protein n=1 Tax=Anopheles sinensis TaxID=74873 RepID=A0A084VH47_ANOSI|nr:hypothetical protein ZHAS_00004508 [Anopheles sinensis]